MMFFTVAHQLLLAQYMVIQVAKRHILILLAVVEIFLAVYSLSSPQEVLSMSALHDR